MVFDCCRQKLKDSTRGGEEETKASTDVSDPNIIIIYGCPPNKLVPAKSTIATAFFERLREKANDATGEVTLPYALVGWRGIDPNIKSEVLPLTEVECKL